MDREGDWGFAHEFKYTCPRDFEKLMSSEILKKMRVMNSFWIFFAQARSASDIIIIVSLELIMYLISCMNLSELLCLIIVCSYVKLEDTVPVCSQ